VVLVAAVLVVLAAVVGAAVELVVDAEVLVSATVVLLLDTGVVLDVTSPFGSVVVLDSSMLLDEGESGSVSETIEASSGFGASIFLFLPDPKILPSPIRGISLAPKLNFD